MIYVHNNNEDEVPKNIARKVLVTENRDGNPKVVV